MSELIQSSNVLNNITDADLSKILGLTVNIQLNNHKEKLTGMIYSFLKQKSFLICIYKIKFHLLVLKKENEENQIKSIFINIKEIQSIEISEIRMNVINSIKSLLDRF